VQSAALLLNRVQPGDLDDETVTATLARLASDGLPLLAVLPESTGLRTASRAGRSAMTLAATDPWRAALDAALPLLLGVPT